MTRDGAVAEKETMRPADKVIAPPSGTFRYRPSTGELVWSDSLYAVYGFAPGEVLPTPALMTSHQHLDERDEWDAFLAAAVEGGQPGTRWHRIVDAQLRPHDVQTSLLSMIQDGEVVEIFGVTADLTPAVDKAVAVQLHDAVAKASETRSVIDQAKGMLMATFDVDEEQAFGILRYHSSFANRKLRDISAGLVELVATSTEAALPPRQRLTALLARLSGATAPKPGNRPLPRGKAGPGSMKPRISLNLLPRTMVRAVASAGVSITIADYSVPGLPLVYANPAFEVLTGYVAEEMMGHNCRFLQGPDTDTATVQAMSEALAEGRDVQTVLLNYRRDGSAFWNELHLSAVRDDDGQITHFIGYQMDVSERVAREQQLEYLAYHDSVTGLPNETAAAEALGHLVARARPFATLAVRLKGLDGPEDAEHAITAAAAAKLATALSPGAALFRLDNGSFLTVETEATGPLGRRIESALTGPIRLEDGDVSVRTSVSRREFPSEATDAQALLQTARPRLAGA